MLARIRRHGRMWGALVVRAEGMNLHWDARQAFSVIGSAANELIDQSEGGVPGVPHGQLRTDGRGRSCQGGHP